MRANGRLHQLFCTNLKAARKQAGMTQQQVADKLRISQAYYAEIEGGKCVPGLDVIEWLAPAFKLAPHELLDPNFALQAVA